MTRDPVREQIDHALAMVRLRRLAEKAARLCAGMERDRDQREQRTRFRATTTRIEREAIASRLAGLLAKAERVAAALERDRRPGGAREGRCAPDPATVRSTLGRLKAKAARFGR